jgi:hypothetical protein
MSADVEAMTKIDQTAAKDPSAEASPDGPRSGFAAASADVCFLSRASSCGTIGRAAYRPSR